MFKLSTYFNFPLGYNIFYDNHYDNSDLSVTWFFCFFISKLLNAEREIFFKWWLWLIDWLIDCIFSKIPFGIISLVMRNCTTWFFLAHQGWKLKWGIMMNLRPSVRLFVNFSHFHLLLQNQSTNFNQTWHKAFLGGGDSIFFKWRASIASFKRKVITN